MEELGNYIAECLARAFIMVACAVGAACLLIGGLIGWLIA